MKENQAKITTHLTNLYSEAGAKGGIEYIYTLVRVAGLTFNVPDPLLVLRRALQAAHNGLSDDEFFSRYRLLTSIDEPLCLVANLLRCAGGKPYNLSPFRHLYTGQFPEETKPTLSQMARELTKMAIDAQMSEIGQLIDEAYPDDILANCSPTGSPPHADRLRAAFKNCHSFLTSLLETYFTERLRYQETPRLYKQPRFEVLELLVNDEYGLYGFRMHFSNGSSAYFARNPDSTEGSNVMPAVPINFMVGNLDKLRDEWRVGEKRLYEVGLPGRYNKLGEWKPIIYPGNAAPIQQDARSLSEDDDVQGVLFYMMCTGHRIIEFVVRTTIELPIQSVTFGEKFHLWKCPPLDQTSHSRQNIRIYDGWLELDSTDPHYIRSAIARIGVAVNRMAFAYNAAVDWCLKYRMVSNGGSYATPSEEDLHILDSILRDFQRADDAIFLDYAIDWYNRGRSSQNVFMAFLCYYIALESVAVPVADGKIDLGLGYFRGDKLERKHERIKCIELKHDGLYSEDPERFVKEAYFECVVGLKEKVRRVAELVFGPSHRHINALFEKRDGYSLTDIRSKIAHGEITLLGWEDKRLASNHLGEMANVTKEFLTRVVFLLKPTDPLPSWSGLHCLTMLTVDPRTTMVASDDRMFPNADWRIRPEWCD